MVAKRDLSPRFPPERTSQAKRRSPSQYGQNQVVTSRSNHSASNGNLPSVPMLANGANNYSDAVTHNVQRKKDKYCKAKATESIIVIAVNVALSLAAVVAIARLLPYQSSQKIDLTKLPPR